MRQFISTSICSLLFSLLLLAASSPASAQMKFFRLQKDSIPVFRGFSVSFDLVGAGMLMFSDYGQYEAALRINLHDEWFPIVEAGIGKADRDDEVTLLHYKTSAPYFKMPLLPIMLTFPVRIFRTRYGNGIRPSISRMLRASCTGQKL